MEKVVEANKFLLRDDAGRIRAELGIEDGTGPILALFDEEQRPRARLAVRFGVPNLALLSENGVSRIELSGGGIGSPSITLCDTAGKPRLDLSLIDAIGGARLAFTDEHEQTRAMVGVEVLEGENRAALILCDKEGRKRARLTVHDDGSSGLEVFDDNGTSRATLGTNGLFIADENATYRVKLSLSTIGPGLGLLDASGTVRAAVALSNETGFPHVILFDKDGRTPRLDLTVDAEGRPRVFGRRWWWPF